MIYTKDFQLKYNSALHLHIRLLQLSNNILIIHVTWTHQRYFNSSYRQCQMPRTTHTSMKCFGMKKSKSLIWIYTNGKKKRCIVKISITRTICSGWAWKLRSIVSLIQPFNFQTFKRFHVRLVCHLYSLWKLLFMFSSAEKQQATKLIDAKHKLIQLMMRKPLCFLLISAYRWQHARE